MSAPTTLPPSAGLVTKLTAPLRLVRDAYHLSLRPRPGESNPTFVEYTRRLSSANLMLSLPGTSIIVLLLLPTDFLVVARSDHAVRAFALSRVAAVAVAIGLYVLFAVARQLQRYPVALFISAQIALSLALVLPIPDALTLHERYIDASYLLPCFPALVLVPLARRIAIVAWTLASWSVGYALTLGADAPPAVMGAYVVTLVAFGMVSIFVGHFFYLRVLDSYEAEKELQGFADALESKVAAQTLQIRELAARQTEALEEERIRVSRELHDEGGQLLSGMRFELDLLKLTADPQKRDDALGRLHGLLERLFLSFRRVLADLRPAILDRDGLAAARHALLDRSSAARVIFARRIDASVARVDPLVGITIYRVAQEAVTNALKHADARTVRVQLRRREGRIELGIEDDGVGYSTTARPSGMGLNNMRERSELLGADLRIDSRPGHTAVWLSCPPRISRPGVAS